MEHKWHNLVSSQPLFDFFLVKSGQDVIKELCEFNILLLFFTVYCWVQKYTPENIILVSCGGIKVRLADTVAVTPLYI